LAGRKYNKLLVVGLYDDRTFRIAAESIFAEELSQKAVDTTPSFNLFVDLDALDDETKIREKLAGTDFDGVLTIAALEVGAGFDYEGYQEQYAMVRLLGSEGVFTRLGANAAYYESGKLKLDVGLWDARTLQSVWHATTDSYSQEAETDEIKTVADFLIEALAERGFIG